MKYIGYILMSLPWWGFGYFALRAARSEPPGNEYWATVFIWCSTNVVVAGLWLTTL